jgi:hypothetical protein
MDTRGELRTKAVVAFVLSGFCLAATPYLAVAKLPPTQHGGKSNGFLTAIAAVLALLSFGIGLLDRRLARLAPLNRPTLSSERGAAARRAVAVLLGGQAVLMTVVGVVLLLGHHVPMALLSFLSAALFLAVIAPTRKPASAKDPADSRPAAALRG